MTRFGDVKLTITGEAVNRKKLMKLLDKVKARYTSVNTIRDEDGSERGFSVEAFVSNHKIWKIRHKLDTLGDFTIN